MEDINMADLTQSSSPQLKADIKPPRPASVENSLIQNILLITRDGQYLGTNGPAAAIAFSGNGAVGELFDLDSVTHPFFERLLMPADQLGKSVVRNPAGKWINRFGRPDQTDVVAYLGECWIRLQQEKLRSPTEDPVLLGRIEGLILENLQLGFQVPDLFAPQSFPTQLVGFYFTTKDQHGEHLTTLIHKLFTHPSSCDFNLPDASSAILTILRDKAKTITLMNMMVYKAAEAYTIDLYGVSLCLFEAVVHFVSTFSTNPITAKLLMDFCTPRNPRDTIGCEQSLLGLLLRLSCLPEHNDVPPEFFESKAAGIGASEIASTEKFVWSNTERAIDAVFGVVNNIVRQSAELREAFLLWVGNCLSANFARAKMWQPNLQFQVSLCSDGFMMNLSAVLLRLCRPFMNPAANPKILKIHPLFAASRKYLRQMAEETTLLPKEEKVPLLNPPADFNFITTCFFLCHESIRLGWGVVWDRFGKLNKHLGELEGRLELARETNNQEERHEIEQFMIKAASRHLSMKAALTLPQNLELMIELSVCTATWLSQMAVQPSITTADLPSAYLPLFPTDLSVPVPVHLAYIPELLLENILEVLHLHHRLPSTTGVTGNWSWQYEWMVELMNVVLVYMPSPARMRNPHLRGKMAMMMHNMMPHKRFADDSYQDRRNAMALALLDVPKEKLFREHPHKSEFMEAVLNIFVSIEMAGANLRFGEAFSYRRPLYAVMEYLFTMPEHQKRVEQLAQDALAKLEATDAPLFLRFLNHLINDATYMLGETLTHMAKIKVLEQEQSSWTALTPEQRQEKERELQQEGEIARYHNILGRDTIQCLKSLTKFRNPSRILLQKVMVNRLADMLNYFLLCLVGADKRSQYRVKDAERYSFEPKDIVAKICAIYVNLGDHDARKDFFLAICQDERSYNPTLFQEAINVLRHFISDSGQLITGMEQLSANVRLAAADKNEEEELLSEDMPDEFQDAIMATLMRDPVKLPSSGNIVDRPTIARMLLTDQMDPFNRQPLTMDQVIPQVELRKQIEEWIQRKRDGKSAGKMEE
ncbi:Ubiquitin conjugation factor E4 A [Hypsibius exemplaris]|uniref:Ubiquitin conjugation factor E4 A n=1 Tax=Hypsibius exemplaris TaxID=2072580 RepID=A0A1W0WWP7_HYPEX|nr:Ubiquitin conjugation factor E4 A [Hypsibius exemplaris]